MTSELFFTQQLILQVLRRLMPEAQLVIVFDCDVDETRSQHLAISKAE